MTMLLLFHGNFIGFLVFVLFNGKGRLSEYLWNSSFRKNLFILIYFLFYWVSLKETNPALESSDFLVKTWSKLMF